MKNEYEDIVVSTKHIKKRTVFFLIAVVVAITAFALAIGRLTHKEEGYYQINPTLSEEVSHAGDGIFLTCYLEGESRDIREDLNRLKAIYSAELERSYKLLDAEKEYEGYQNLATLNGSLGQTVEVGQELLKILADADNRSRKDNNFNLYAGYLMGEWDRILSLSQPEEYDPALNPDSRERLQEFAALCADTDNFSLIVENEEEGKVRIEVAEDFLKKSEALEAEGGILSLGRLKEAYRLDMLRRVLEENGFTTGYLTTNSGLSLALKDYSQGRLTLYGCEEGKAKQLAALGFPTGGSAAMLRSFGMTEEETLYYRIEYDGKILYRYPWFRVENGEYPGLLSSCVVISEQHDIVETAAQALNLYAAASEKELEGLAGEKGNRVVWTLTQDPKTLYDTGEDYQQVAEGIRVERID